MLIWMVLFRVLALFQHFFFLTKHIRVQAVESGTLNIGQNCFLEIILLVKNQKGKKNLHLQHEKYMINLQELYAQG